MVGQAKLTAMPAELKQEYIKDMTTEIDKRAQLKYAIEQGLEKGEAIGMSKGKNEVARAMLHEKMPVETISRLTGLSPEQIQAL